MGGIIRNKVARIVSGALVGFDGALIEVEADLKAGLPALQIVGMGNKAIDEARQRVRSAISNSLLDFPAQKITINLAPAELPKDGTHFDLPIALSILVASKQLNQAEVDNALFAGELALDGSIRPVRGVITLAERARDKGIKRLYVPINNTSQALLVSGIEVIGISTLQGLYRGLRGLAPLSPALPTPASNNHLTPHGNEEIFDTIIGHEQAKRALAIAAAGRHNILFTGSPGAGKTLLARALNDILPPLSFQESIEVTKLHSLATGDDGTVYTTPPFRSPHHSVTLTALIGGGLKPRPGDISLAHKGVLFLDELPEYPRATLEALRQPLEDRAIHLSRLYGKISWPADVLMVSTMNPCPCGYLGDMHVSCTCSTMQVENYRRKISGPLLDRIDLRVAVSKVNHEHFLDANMMNNKQRSTVVSLVLKARKAQHKRYKRSDFYNAHASLKDAKKHFKLTASARQLLDSAVTKMNLTSRGYLRTLRVARTIADLESSQGVELQHVTEALQYR